MAVKDDCSYYPTDAIVSKRSRKHYKVPVQSHHWQLRSLISAEKRHLVYFPGGNGCNHVQRLNTTTQECDTIKLLTFAPRCLTAENGWLCCGSENGDFVSIRLEDEADLENLDLSFDLGQETESSPDPILNLITRSRRNNKSMIAKSKKMAKDRVNCITMWFPPKSKPSQEVYSVPVAVLANNDRTVTLAALDSSEQDDKEDPLDVITYPDFVNRAIISPDGKLLVAILDDPYLYVHHRAEKLPPARANDWTDYTWRQTQRILLKSQRRDDRSDGRGSFAACFSESGARLAVGTQHGTISIFDVARLSDPDSDALITTFQSTRPETNPGAVRDMAFCPGPYDILAWTEDRGHIGIADVRTGFISRQILDLNADGDYEHFNILDRNTVDPRLLENRSERRRSTSTSELNRDAESSETRRPSEIGMEHLNSPLSATETIVLEALQQQRRRQERIAARQLTNDSERLARMSRAVAAASLRPPLAEGRGSAVRERSSSISQAMDYLSNSREQRERALDLRSPFTLPREDSDRPQLPRRVDARLLERLSDRIRAEEGGSRSDRYNPSYLGVLEILQSRDRGSNEERSGDAALNLPLGVNRWEESAIRGTLPSDGVFDVPPSPDNTAGLSWSSDGRILFVGAQNGIYEFHVNTHGRKFWPSVNLR